MNKSNCLIVDDEPIARDIIKTYCGYLDFLAVTALCGNALEAKAIMTQHKIDILFLDINMPVLDGISFLKTLKDRPAVIFTTAYKEYAVDAFDLAVCDYLFKPFSFDRFIIAVDKALANIGTALVQNSINETNLRDDYIFVKSNDKVFKLAHEDLIYAEANGNNTKIFTKDKVLLPAMSFSNFEDLLPGDLFLRVHRSFIVNKNKINYIEGNRILIGDKEIPIGQVYKETFYKKIGYL